MLLIQNGRVLDPWTGTDAQLDVLIGNDGVIAKIAEKIDAPADCKSFDAAGLTVSPGFVDGHVHFRDPGQTQKEDVLTGAAAAAAGGYATVICMANTVPTCDTPEIIHYVTDKAKNCPVQVLQAGAVTKGLKGEEMTDFDALLAAGAPCLTDDGINLLDPGKTPHENVQFLMILTCILRAVDRHADLLRESAADPGNDHRLGANEAPPAIISVFLGEQLEDVLEQLISTGTATHSKAGGVLHTGVKRLPDFAKDATDRNRTSPFAFTGNKFEFRMVGSRDSVAECNVVINTIVAEAFSDACDRLEKAEDFELAVHDLIKEYATEHQRIVFNGNGYSEEWVEEAKRRGLPNINSMVEAIPALVTDKAIQLFGKFGVFTEAELRSRAEIQYEGYSKALNIEARAMIDIASKHIIPAVMRFSRNLAGTVNEIKTAGADVTVPMNMLKDTTALLSQTKLALAKLQEAADQAAAMENGREQAEYYHEVVFKDMEELRVPVDKLEMIVDKEAWPMPSYGDLMFEV